MDTSGCTARFDEKELARVLPSKSLELLQRLRFAQELEDAAIEGLETCPSCPWAVVIDSPTEKLFRCMNEACGKVSCRQCRKVEHLPKSCEGKSSSTLCADDRICRINQGRQETCSGRCHVRGIDSEMSEMSKTLYQGFWMQQDQSTLLPGSRLMPVRQMRFDFVLHLSKVDWRVRSLCGTSTPDSSFWICSNMPTMGSRRSTKGCRQRTPC